MSGPRRRMRSIRGVDALGDTDRQRDPRIEQVAALLRSQSTLTLSTCGEDGWPQATPLFYYLDDDLTLYWFSSPRSAHSRQVLRERRGAVAVCRPTEDWREIRGVQMRGDVSVITGPMRKRITTLYCERFRLGPAFGLMIMKHRLFGFRPAWIRYLDNGEGLGYKFEIALPGPAQAGDCASDAGANVRRSVVP
jgi:uncharacterized protein